MVDNTVLLFACDQESKRAKALELATKLLTLPSPMAVQQHVKSLLASLFPTKQAYHNHKVSTVMAPLSSPPNRPTTTTRKLQ